MRGRPTIFADDVSDEEAAAIEAYMLEVYRSGRNPEWDRICECGVLDLHNH